MDVVIIVNIIVSLSIMLGGLCMKKYADNTEDHSIGFKTARAMANNDTWRFANSKCGNIWSIIGLAALALTIACLFMLPDLSFAQPAVLILLFAAVVISAVWVEIQLKNNFGDPK